MLTMLVVLLLFVFTLVLCALKLSLLTCSLLMGVALLVTISLDFLPSWLWLFYLCGFVLLNHGSLRRQYISQGLLQLFIRYSHHWPAPEPTSFNTWLEQPLSTGRLRWQDLFTLSAPRLSAAEQAFLTGPVDNLCRLSLMHPSSLNSIAKPCWSLILQQGFLRLCPAKDIEQTGYSLYFCHKVIQKVANADMQLAAHLASLNSLDIQQWTPNTDASPSQPWHNDPATWQSFILDDAELALLQQGKSLEKPLPCPFSPQYLLLIYAPTDTSCRRQAFFVEASKVVSEIIIEQKQDEYWLNILQFPHTILTSQMKNTAPWQRLPEVQSHQLWQGFQAKQQLLQTALQSAEMKRALLKYLAQQEDDKAQALLQRLVPYEASIMMTCVGLDNGENAPLICDLLNRIVKNTRHETTTMTPQSYFQYLYCCHPFLTQEYLACWPDPDITAFDSHIFSHYGYSMSQLIYAARYRFRPIGKFKAKELNYFIAVKKLSHLQAVLGELLLFGQLTPSQQHSLQQKCLLLLSKIYELTSLLRCNLPPAVTFSAMDKCLNEVDYLLQNIKHNLPLGSIQQLLCYWVIPSHSFIRTESDDNQAAIKAACASSSRFYRDLIQDVFAEDNVIR
ncbi:acyl-CoA dehydrogenase domain-containing protein [Motilimonas pumila]|uniref:Uncharacterized protein n=1 Tax=Motilimonas pumila TaxID=2303987 RepID=A0A418YH94_9GAMM|nr:acyl-CoA dehydrogenase domain-containing protein [Motilimonas pumila]RJG49079.1 hypothetical protein D1Z90_06855 [Motilimonas pumila]